MTRTTSIAFCLVWMLLPNAAADPQPLGDPQAGYVLDIDDGHEWVSEVSYSPGITSKLCIERADPAMILCVQSLQRKMALADRAGLAEGYFAALEKRYPSKAQPERHAEVFGLLEGQGQRFVTTSSELPNTRRWVIAFAGTNTHGQPQMAVAFADPNDRDRASTMFERILSAIVYQAGDRTGV